MYAWTGGGTGTSREALEDKTRRRRERWRWEGAFLQSHCPLLLSRGLSREPCPKSLAPRGRLSIVNRWPLQAGLPAATAAASCPPTHISPPLHLQHHDNAPCGQGHRPVESIKKGLEDSLEKGRSGATCLWAEH